ncbi:hypothetical protein CGMCC3_g3443 [Colletotrichum fructicola]|nr:uncharacterized protein CGMCC3_g3443 [Colletotrichum fructicola]KAE9580663.1 hypothetical protein CGMCC3_g3443 [Colletotrichum fructicola]
MMLGARSFMIDDMTVCTCQNVKDAYEIETEVRLSAGAPSTRN